jgi:hypothetical protein
MIQGLLSSSVVLVISFGFLYDFVEGESACASESVHDITRSASCSSSFIHQTPGMDIPHDGIEIFKI